ncbi:MAG: NAD-dependent epimerase/dehydratase family protein [Planctomycetota bacterium]
MRVLVTGATGFIGVRLVRALVERGDEVACLKRAAKDGSELERLGAEIATGDLGDEVSLRAAIGETFGGRRAERVYHLAGLTHATNLDDFLRVNADGTERLVRAAAGATNPPTVVLTSSLAAAGPSPPGEPHTEATPAEPISNYGRSKLAAENVARAFADRLPISILRPPVVFGPGDRDGLLLFQSLRRFPLHVVPQMKGLPLSLVYVDDLVEALIAVAERGERLAADGTDSTGLYYAADPEASSYAQMGRMAAAAMDKKVWVLCRRKYPFLIPALAGDLIGRIRGKAPLFGMDKLREASASGWVCDPAKIMAGLGWNATKAAAERYAETHRWYVENGWL